MSVVKKALICHYSYDKSVLMLGGCDGQELIIESYETKTNTSIDEMTRLLKSSIPLPTFKKGLYINNHVPLSLANSEAIIIDFTGDKTKDLNESKDFLCSLRDDKRLKILFTPKANTDIIETALCMVVKVFTLRLSGKIKQHYLSGMNPYPVYDTREFLDGDEWDNPKQRRNYSMSIGG